MNFEQIINEKYGDVSWTGGSHIHKSVYGEVTNIPFCKGKQQEVLAKLFSGEYANKLYEKLTTTFDTFEFLISRREFTVIFLDDVLRYLQGLGDRQDESKLVNFNTGNVFNLIARDGELVAGIRFWVNDDGISLWPMYRFRITSIGEDKTITTTRIKLVADGALTKLAEEGLIIGLIEEPPTEVNTIETIKIEEA
jgi:hypothetical protein